MENVETSQAKHLKMPWSCQLKGGMVGGFLPIYRLRWKTLESLGFLETLPNLPITATTYNTLGEFLDFPSLFEFHNISHLSKIFQSLNPQIYRLF